MAMVQRRRGGMAWNIGFRRPTISQVLQSEAMQKLGKKSLQHFKKQAQFPKSKTTLQRKLGSWKATSKPHTTARRTLRDTDTFNEDLGAGGELTKMHVSTRVKGSGSPKKKLAHLVKDNSETQIFRFGAMNPFMNVTQSNINSPLYSSPGAYSLALCALTNSNLVCPVHLYDITSLNNIVNNQVQNYNPAFQLGFDSNVGTARVNFSNLPCKFNDGTAGSTWFYENVSGSNSTIDVYPKKSSFQDYFHAKLLCYGASTFATEYAIDVIQLKDEYLHPDWLNNAAWSGALPNTAAINYAKAAVGFWDYVAKPYMGTNPLATITGSFSKHMKILKSLRFTLQPRLSTETDNPAGHCKQVNLFVKLNRKNKYDWIEGGTDPLLTSGTTWISQQGQDSTTVNPKARIYLMIRATNSVLTQLPAAPSYSNSPSYDLVLRTKHTWLSG